VSVLEINTRGATVSFPVRLQPRASKNEITGIHGGAMRVLVTAPPVEGAANEALVGLIAKELRVAKRNVTIVSGASSRNKVVEVIGISPAAVIELCR